MPLATARSRQSRRRAPTAQLDAETSDVAVGPAAAAFATHLAGRFRRESGLLLALSLSVVLHLAASAMFPWLLRSESIEPIPRAPLVFELAAVVPDASPAVESAEPPVRLPPDADASSERPQTDDGPATAVAPEMRTDGLRTDEPRTAEPTADGATIDTVAPLTRSPSPPTQVKPRPVPAPELADVRPPGARARSTPSSEMTTPAIEEPPMSPTPSVAEPVARSAPEPAPKPAPHPASKQADEPPSRAGLAALDAEIAAIRRAQARDRAGMAVQSTPESRIQPASDPTTGPPQGSTKSSSRAGLAALDAEIAASKSRQHPAMGEVLRSRAASATSAATERQLGGKASAARTRRAEGRYLSALRHAIERRRHYPESARRLRLEGTTRVQFTIGSDGAFSAIRVVQSAGHAGLDEAAIASVRQLGRFRPIPEAVGRSRWTVRLPLVFRLD